jgi:hypothetical protein
VAAFVRLGCISPIRKAGLTRAGSAFVPRGIHTLNAYISDGGGGWVWPFGLQAESDIKGYAEANPRACAARIPAQVAQGMLWIWPDTTPEGQ